MFCLVTPMPFFPFWETCGTKNAPLATNPPFPLVFVPFFPICLTLSLSKGPPDTFRRNWYQSRMGGLFSRAFVSVNRNLFPSPSLMPWLFDPKRFFTPCTLIFDSESLFVADTSSRPPGITLFQLQFPSPCTTGFELVFIPRYENTLFENFPPPVFIFPSLPSPTYRSPTLCWRFVPA